VIFYGKKYDHSHAKPFQDYYGWGPPTTTTPIWQGELKDLREEPTLPQLVAKQTVQWSQRLQAVERLSRQTDDRFSQGAQDGLGVLHCDCEGGDCGLKRFLRHDTVAPGLYI